MKIWPTAKVGSDLSVTLNTLNLRPNLAHRSKPNLDRTISYHILPRQDPFLVHQIPGDDAETKQRWQDPSTRPLGLGHNSASTTHRHGTVLPHPRSQHNLSIYYLTATSQHTLTYHIMMYPNPPNLYYTTIWCRYVNTEECGCRPPSPIASRRFP